MSLKGNDININNYLMTKQWMLTAINHKRRIMGNQYC